MLRKHWLWIPTGLVWGALGLSAYGGVYLEEQAAFLLGMIGK